MLVWAGSCGGSASEHGCGEGLPLVETFGSKRVALHRGATNKLLLLRVFLDRSTGLAVGPSKNHDGRDARRSHLMREVGSVIPITSTEQSRPGCGAWSNWVRKGHCRFRSAALDMTHQIVGHLLEALAISIHKLAGLRVNDAKGAYDVSS